MSEGINIIVSSSAPPTREFQASGCHHYMNVGIEFKPAIERMRDRDHSDLQPKLGADPRLDGLRGKNWQEPRKLPIAEEGP